MRLAKHGFDVLKIDLMRRPILCALSFMPFELVKLGSIDIACAFAEPALPTIGDGGPLVIHNCTYSTYLQL